MKVDTRQFDKLMDKLELIPDNTVKDAGKFFKAKTPIDTGNARRNTRTNVNSKTITGNYGYAAKLDDGWSKQAPKGMSEPTIDHIEKLINQQVGKL